MSLQRRPRIQLSGGPLNPYVRYFFADPSTDDDDAQEGLWIHATLARPAGVLDLEPIVFRCSVHKCGAILGSVVAEPAQGTSPPLTWIEMQRIVEPGDVPRTRLAHMVLDDRRGRLTVRAECLAHGIRQCSVESVLDQLPTAMARARKLLTVPALARKAKGFAIALGAP
jgi:hypothetical protein